MLNNDKIMLLLYNSDMYIYIGVPACIVVVLAMLVVILLQCYLVKKHYRDSTRPSHCIHNQDIFTLPEQTSAGQDAERTYFTRTTATTRPNHHFYQELNQTLEGVYLTPPANVNISRSPPRSPFPQRNPTDQLPPVPSTNSKLSEDEDDSMELQNVKCEVVYELIPEIIVDEYLSPHDYLALPE